MNERRSRRDRTIRLNIIINMIKNDPNLNEIRNNNNIIHIIMKE